MPQDAFTLRFVAGELNEKLKGGKISRIIQPSKDELILLIYTQVGTVKLTIDLSAKFCRASLSEKREQEPPAAAPNFCMLLRKHLQNAEILNISQIGFERVLKTDFRCFSEFEITDMSLYLEIMGKYSNAVLVKDGIIVGALKSTSLENAKRVTFTGAAYRLPARQDKADPTNLSELKAAFENKCGPTTEFIADKIAGIAYVTAADIVEEFGENITAEQLYSYVASDEISPCVTDSDFKARLCKGAKSFPSVLEAQAAYYDRAIELKEFADLKRRFSSIIAAAEKKVVKRLAQINEKLEECKKCEDIKLKAELITANIYAVKRGDKDLKAVNYYDENGGTVTIELDPVLTPSQNAQKYYKKYAKLKRTAENLSGQKVTAEEKLSYLSSVKLSLDTAEIREDFAGIEEELISLSLLPPPPKKKGAKIKEPSAYRTYLFNGCKVLCGRNNIGNDRLTKGLSQGDMWLHTKTYHSSHVAIIPRNGGISDETIKFAAEICAYFSEARQNDKVAVDYTPKKFVKKPNGAAAGFVTYTDFKTILVAPNAHREELIDE